MKYWIFVDVDVESLPDEASTVHYAKRREMLKTAMSVVNQLTEKQQRRFSWYFYDDMTLQEIAILEHASTSAIKKSIDQSIVQIRRKMWRYL